MYIVNFRLIIYIFAIFSIQNNTCVNKMVVRRIDREVFTKRKRKEAYFTLIQNYLPPITVPVAHPSPGITTIRLYTTVTMVVSTHPTP